MSGIRVEWHGESIHALLRSPGVGQELRKVAIKVEGRVRAPARLTLSHRAGVGPKGAFSQVIMSGPGALFEEFGSKRRAARAPLRNALFGVVK